MYWMIKESCGNKELRILIVNIRILKHEEAFNEVNKIKLYIPLGITKRKESWLWYQSELLRGY